MNAATLIVSYNTREDLRACLRSLLASGAPPASIYVADNASTDGSFEMLLQEFPQVHSVRNRRNLLYAEAMNRLLAVSRSDWVLLLNPDVICHYDELVLLCESWQPDTKCAAVAPQFRYFDGRIQPSCRRLPDALEPWREAWGRLLRRSSVWKMGDFDHRSARTVEQPMFSCIWIRRSVLSVVGDLDPRYPLFFNDVDWCCRALAKGYEIQFDPSVAVLHKHGGTTNLYPIRKLYQSNRSFARHIWTSSETRPVQVCGLLGLGLSFVLRLPMALRRSVRRAVY